MKTKIIPIILIFFLFANKQSYAQREQRDSIKHIQIGFVPHYAIYKGLRMDLEYIFKDQYSHIQVSPQIYTAQNAPEYSESSYYSDEYDDPEFKKLSGYGVGLDYKIFMFYTKRKVFGMYSGIGVDYAHFSIDYAEFDWVVYNEDNLEYYSYNLAEKSQETDRLKFGAYVGMQLNIARSFYISGYMGCGYAYSVSENNLESEKIEYTRRMWNYAYSGVYFPLGFKFGVRF